MIRLWRRIRWIGTVEIVIGRSPWLDANPWEPGGMFKNTRTDELFLIKAVRDDDEHTRVLICRRDYDPRRSRLLIAKIVLAAVLVAVLALYVAGVARGALVFEDGSRAEPFSTWAEDWRVELPAGDIVVNRNTDACNVDPRALGVVACASQTGSISLDEGACLWSSKQASDRRLCEWMAAHELGHHRDWQMPEWKRDVFRKITRSSFGWDQVYGSRLPDRERFADSVAQCALGSRRVVIDLGWSWQTIEPRFSLGPTQYRRICRLINQPS